MYAELEASGVGGGATARAGVGASANAAAPAATSAARRDDTAGDDEPEGSTDAAKTAPARGRRVARGDARERARAANGVGTTRATRMLVCRSEDERVPDRIAELAADTISSLVSCGARFRCSAVSPTLTDPPRPPPPAFSPRAAMGKNKNGGQASSGGVGSTGGVPTLTLEQFADALAPSGGGGGGGRGGGKSATSKSGAHKSGDASTSGAPTVEVARWDVDPRVHLLRFASAAAQRDAMGRPSIFLEDLDLHGTIPERVPTGQRGGVANYSGHNMRARDLARFINRLRAERPGGAAETPAESSLVAALSSCGALRSDKSGRVVAARDDLVVAAVAGSSDKNEVRDALLHEAMHMVFYVDEAFAERCWSFWRERATERDKTAWIAFLRDLRYNVEDEELVVNELQAYMCTERQMFGESGGGGRGGKRGGGGGGGGGDDALASLQARFAAFIKEHLPSPPSVGAGTRVVWL